MAVALFSLWGIAFASTALAVAPQVEKLGVSEVSSTAATLEADVDPQGAPTKYHFEYGPEPCASSACTAVPVPDGELSGGSSVVRVKVPVEGLSPGTIYHFRLVAKNPATTTSSDRVFATYSASVLEGLPENRGYEQASPINKDGGDAVGSLPIVKAASDGGGISFGSTFGIPGGVGAQELPTYLARRSGEPGIWSTQGLLPPALLGERAQVMGWLPDYSKTFTKVSRLGNPRTTALVEQSTDGKKAVLMTPYVANAEYFYAGANADGSVVFFETEAKLTPAALEGAFNLYAWDEATGEVHLAGVLNDEQAPAKGAFAGPYSWGEGANASSLSKGGANRSYYLQDSRAITEGGDIYFTAAGTGQLYLRVNPTRPQSTMNGEECLKAEDACTIHVSASKRTPPDKAGPQPAAFQAASADGSKVFFTSFEKLTQDANTGPEQPDAKISLADIDGSNENADFIPKKAVGVAVDDKYIYWANPDKGTIGRANLDGTGVNDEFIVIPAGECEVEVKEGVSAKASIPSLPRYLAIQGEYIYWTNTGLLEKEPARFPIGGGTIGRAKLNGEEASVDPDFICGASNPQGIAVNATHIYWANAGQPLRPSRRYISRAKIDGSDLEYKLVDQFTSGTVLMGVALDATNIYFSVNDGNGGYIFKAPLTGGHWDDLLFIGEAGLRGIAVDNEHVYWASQSEEAIGRAPLDFSSKENEFIPVSGKPAGLAEDATHLYWSINGEAPVNPGNDLYLYEPEGEALEDLTPDSSTANGAEVQGVLGASEDGSRVYFVANGDLDGAGPATAGDCETAVPHGAIDFSTSGQCNLYLQTGGQTTFIARMQAPLDATNWVPTPRGLFGSEASYTPKTSFLSPDGRTLLFRSVEQLSTYQNEGVAELYRYREGDPEGIRCVSCPPGGQRAGEGPSTGSIEYPIMGPRGDVAATSSRILSADGDRVFFETAEALSPLDTNGSDPLRGCPLVGQSATPACLDVYEWAAPGTPGTGCAEASPSYSPLNAGCIYLISTGKDKYPSFFADASQSGEDVFFFTRQQLVGQDKDALQDVYDARVGGGLASQNPATVIPCESVEACHGPIQVPPAEPSGGSATFVGPANPVPKRTKKAGKKKTNKKHKAKKHKKSKGKKHKANNKGRASR